MSDLVLVTGGTGFIGSALVRELLRSGFDIRILDDDSRGRSARLGDIRDSVELVRGDVRDLAAVRRAMTGASAVAHLAFINGTEFFYSKPELVLEVAVKGIVNTLDAAIQAGVGRYYLMSSSEVYQLASRIPTDESVAMSIPDPLNPRYSYAGGKIISELMAINYGRRYFEKTVIVRPHNVYGPDMGQEHVIPAFAIRMKQQMARHPSGTIPFEIQGDGLQTRAFVYIDDFVDGCARAFLQGDNLGIYHVGTQEEVPMTMVAQLVAKACDRQIELLAGPERAGGTPRRCPDISKVRALGYEPKVSLEEGVRQTVAWYLAH
jgi:nucleoside-diphosphate-sugar epimerase